MKRLSKAKLCAVARAADDERQRLAAYLAGKRGVTLAEGGRLYEGASPGQRLAWRVEAKRVDTS